MNIRRGAFLLLAIIVSTALSWASTLPASCGKPDTVIEVATRKHQPVSTAPEAGTAKVFFIEEADKNALPVTTRTAVDGAWLGANRGNSYFESTIPPGNHHVCVDWQLNHRFIRDEPSFDVFQAEAGKVYYFLVHVQWTLNVNMVGYGQPDGHMTLNLSAVNEDEGQYLVQNAKFSAVAKKK